MAVCAYEACGLAFLPKRSNQRFHSPECRAAFWHEHRHGGVHKCPLCGALHDPEERDVLAALDMLVATTDFRELASEVGAFIARRRAISAP